MATFLLHLTLGNIVGPYVREPMDWGLLFTFFALFLLGLPLLNYLIRKSALKKTLHEQPVPVYKVKDVLHQAKADHDINELVSLEMPAGTFEGKRFGFKLFVWLIIIMMILVPLYATVENQFWAF